MLFLKTIDLMLSLIANFLHWWDSKNSNGSISSASSKFCKEHFTKSISIGERYDKKDSSKLDWLAPYIAHSINTGHNFMGKYSLKSWQQLSIPPADNHDGWHALYYLPLMCTVHKNLSSIQKDNPWRHHLLVLVSQFHLAKSFSFPMDMM